MRFIAALVGAACIAGVSSAQITYNDAAGDATGNSFGELGGTHMDITGVTVSHDATNVYFNIQLSNLGADWGKYGILIDSKAGGVSSPSNAWGRAINTAVAVDYWLGSWADSGGGAQLWKNNGASWDGVEFRATYNGNLGQSINWGGGSILYTIARADIDMASNGTFYFDVVTTGGGGSDPGIDHLSVQGDAGGRWSGTPSTTGDFLAYTIPTPGALALLGAGVVVAARRRRA